eukprot:GGOE01065490.1.p1 GENE.GGOE01065490.1~~GGOE01065490.1.p1  ORF type:complete len:738 (-),score=189.06 GGOE01065490.1:255-2408(-)
MAEHESKLNPMAQAFVPLNRPPPVPLFVNPQLQQTPGRPFLQHQHQPSPKLPPQLPPQGQSPPRPGLPPPVPLFINPDLMKQQPLPPQLLDQRPPLFHSLQPGQTFIPGGPALPLFPPPPGQPQPPSAHPRLAGQPPQHVQPTPPTMLGHDPAPAPLRPLFPQPGPSPLQPGTGPTAVDFQRFQQQFVKRPAGQQQQQQQQSPLLSSPEGLPFRMPQQVGAAPTASPPMTAIPPQLAPGPIAGHGPLLSGVPAPSMPPPHWVPGAPVQALTPPPAHPDRPPEPVAMPVPGGVPSPPPKAVPPSPPTAPPAPSAGKGSAHAEAGHHLLQQLSQLQLQQGASLNVQYIPHNVSEAASATPAAVAPAAELPKGAGSQQLQQLLSILPKGANVEIRESAPAQADGVGKDKDKDRPDLPPDPSILSAGPLLPKGTFDDMDFDEELEARGTRYCFNCGGTDHTVKSCKHPLFCTHCRRYGHTSNVCFKKQAEDEAGEEGDEKAKGKEAKAAAEEKEGKADTKITEAKAGYINMDRRRPAGGAEEAVRGRVGCFNCGSSEHTAKMCPEPLFCTLCKNRGHTANKCKRCHNCGGYHLLSECTKPRVCSRCHREGHTSNVCNASEGKGEASAARAKEAAVAPAEDQAASKAADTRAAPEEPPPASDPPSGDAEVNRILGQLGLLRYAAIFAEFGIDFVKLKAMTPEEYEVMDIPEKAFSRIRDTVA